LLKKKRLGGFPNISEAPSFLESDLGGFSLEEIFLLLTGGASRGNRLRWFIKPVQKRLTPLTRGGGWGEKAWVSFKREGISRRDGGKPEA